MNVSTRALIIGLGLTAFSATAYAQNAPTKEADTVVVTGTRVAQRSVLNTAAPVDVVTSSQLATQGSAELNQQLAVALPSFNFPRPAITDGTDSVRPATLRGLSPDQTLVLLNGKRQHTAALVNINGSVGRGSSAVDLNTIPTGAIESVEVLRDGASAQYGSDAIAGVINLRLKKKSHGGNLTATYGQRITTVKTSSAPALAAGTTNFNAADVIKNPTWGNPSSRDVNDGETLTVTGWVGLPFFNDGSLTISGDVQTRNSINRQAFDNRRLYPLVGTAFDPREVTANRLNQQYGDGELIQGTVFANAEVPMGDNSKLYGWLTAQGRDSTTSAFYRWPSDSRNVASIYPNGFLPKINALISDVSSAFGYSTKLGAWDFDSSLTYGSNAMEYYTRDTLNRSIGAGSPTSFYDGGFSNEQLVLNVSGVKEYEVGLASPLNVAIGAEAREDSFEIHAGEVGSYYQSGSFPAGAQGFGGFKPSNAIDESRSAIGAYVDLEANVTDKLLVSTAVRYENYSDFGENVSGKVSGRYDFSSAIALRGSYSTGFRAPSLQQQFFTTASTNVVNGAPVEILTVGSTSDIGLALGGKPLKAEESTNYSLGTVLRLGKFSVTIDAYQIKMKDRIVLSENLDQTPVKNLLISKGINGIGAARFFLNGVDTTTSGADIVASYRFKTENYGKFDIAVSGNVNETTVDKVPYIAELTNIGLTPTQLFGRVNTILLTDVQPKAKAGLNLNWSKGKLASTFKANYYGEVTDPNADPALDLVLPPEGVFDLEVRYKHKDKLTFTLGADNITDVYPKMIPSATLRSAGSSTTYAALNAQSALGFSRFSPFGFSGRYVYGKVSFDF
jgi:iron complex outermembrane recepter protein